MKLAVISDIHLGDSSSSIAAYGPQTQAVRLGVGYEELRDTIRARFSGEPLDYLVLLGDILDLSVAHYSDAYKIAGTFFQQLVEDGLLRKRETERGMSYGPVMYVCGNHDVDLWNTVEYQVNIIKRIQAQRKTSPLRMSIPGIIHDDPISSEPEVILHRVGSGKFPKYGGLFLDHLTDPPISFYFGFPNLYLVSDHGTVLMTHGQYLSFYWSILGHWGVDIFNGDLDLKQDDEMDLEEAVSINHPTGQLGCSALGQAGPLTNVIRRLEHDIKKHDVVRLKRYLTSLRRKLVGEQEGCSRLLLKVFGPFLQKYLLKQFEESAPARGNEGFLKDKRVWERFLDFYNSTIYEVEELNARYPFRIPYPERLIYGHTHCPIPWMTPQKYSVPAHRMAKPQEFLVSNTGGWLCHAEEKGPGAEIFFYETGKGFSSKRVHYEASSKAG